MPAQLARPRRDFLFNAIGSAFGLGLSPIAPGSFGALLGVAYAIPVMLYLPVAWRSAAMAVCSAWLNFA